MNYTTKKIDEISVECTEAMRKVAEKYGLNIRPAGGSVTLGVEAVIKFRLTDANASPMLKHEESFKANCYLHDLEPEDLGREIIGADGKHYFIVGYKPRNRKMPLLISSCYPVATTSEGGFTGVRKAAPEFIKEILED